MIYFRSLNAQVTPFITTLDWTTMRPVRTSKAYHGQQEAARAFIMLDRKPSLQNGIRYRKHSRYATCLLPVFWNIIRSGTS